MATPAILRVLRNPPRLTLEEVTGAATAYSLRRLYWYSNYAIRVRDNTNAETDIGFSGEGLDIGGLMGWLGRNLVASSPLNVDTNANNVSDGWSLTNDAGNSYISSVDSNGQYVEITDSTATSKFTYITQTINCVEGNVFTVNIGELLIPTSNTVHCTIEVAFRKSDNTSISSSTSSAFTKSDSVQSVSFTSGSAPALTAKVFIRIKLGVSVIGQKGSMRVNNASVKISNQSAYVTEWYDQSGNGLDAVQATAGNQPRIVNAGVLVTDSGRPAIETILANDTHFVVANDAKLQFTTNATACFVHNPTSVGKSGVAGRIFDKNNSSDYLVAMYPTSGIAGYTGATFSANGTITFGATNINTVTHDSINNKTNFYVSGNLYSTRTASAKNATNTPLYLLNRVTLDRQYDGKISELILFGITLSDAQRQKIERNQGRYFNINVA